MLLRLGRLGPASIALPPEAELMAEFDAVSSAVLDADDVDAVSSLESRDDSIWDRFGVLCAPTPAIDMVVSFHVPPAICVTVPCQQHYLGRLRLENCAAEGVAQLPLIQSCDKGCQFFRKGNFIPAKIWFRLR
jgi:hypothetical protein